MATAQTAKQLVDITTEFVRHNMLHESMLDSGIVAFRTKAQFADILMANLLHKSLLCRVKYDDMAPLFQVCDELQTERARLMQSTDNVIDLYRSTAEMLLEAQDDFYPSKSVVETQADA